MAPDAAHRPVVSAVGLGLGVGGDAVGVGDGEAVGEGVLESDGAADGEGDAVDCGLAHVATSRTAMATPALRMAALP
jgi:hypothetical protein